MCISLSLYIYIYIYTCLYGRRVAVPAGERRLGGGLAALQLIRMIIILIILILTTIITNSNDNNSNITFADVVAGVSCSVETELKRRESLRLRLRIFLRPTLRQRSATVVASVPAEGGRRFGRGLVVGSGYHRKLYVEHLCDSSTESPPPMSFGQQPCRSPSLCLVQRQTARRHGQHSTKILWKPYQGLWGLGPSGLGAWGRRD